MGCGTIDRMNELKCGSPRRLLALVGLTAIALVAAQAEGKSLNQLATEVLQHAVQPGGSS